MFNRSILFNVSVFMFDLKVCLRASAFMVNVCLICDDIGKMYKSRCTFWRYHKLNCICGNNGSMIIFYAHVEEMVEYICLYWHKF